VNTFESKSREDRLISLKQVLGSYLPVSKTKLFALLKDGSLPAVKLGRRTYIRHSVLQSYIASLDAAR
jgi:excisionase family DNA binding protein